MTSGRTYLTREAALRSILHKIEEEPKYSPGWYRAAQLGLEQLREYIKDLEELMKDQRTEGDS